jgi:hypothetical protein
LSAFIIKWGNNNKDHHLDIPMPKKTGWCLFILYLAIFGSYCGLEVNTFVEDLPFFQAATFLIFFNTLFVFLIPPLLYAILAAIPALSSSRAARTGILILNSVYLHLAILFSLYKAGRHIDFDFYFFWYNLSVALSVLWKLFAPWLFALALSIAIFVLIQKTFFSPVIEILNKSRKAWIFLVALTISSMICQLATLQIVRSSAAGFLYANFLSDRHLKNEYRELYDKHITALQSKRPTAGAHVDPSVLGDTIIFVQQESLSDLLVSPNVTPQLLNASRDGLLFRKLYGNSIQSERGYECILCGAPPSAEGDLVNDYTDEVIKKLPCLPRVFKELGYRPLLFYSGNPNPRVTHLFDLIGFEKIFADDIMKPGDVQYNWGYREDTFFARVDEYLQKHYKNEKLFIFITASASNHTPFKVLDNKLLDKIPFPQPTKFEENLSNTTFVQDAYLGVLYDIFKKHYALRGSLLAVSDHSWPIPIHKHNIYNERGAFEENFLISMLFVPPESRRGDFSIGSTVSQRFSQMDIVPTVLDLIGMKQDYMLGESFAPWLLASQRSERLGPRKTKISVQPYGGGCISVIQFPKKYLFDVLGRNVKVFDLKNDPREQSPAIHDAGEYLHIIRDFFQPRESDVAD